MVRKSLFLIIVVALLGSATTACAQYGGGGMGGAGTGMGGTTAGTPSYTQKSYGVNTAALGAGLGAGAVGGVLLVRHFHHPHTMTACVGSDGKTLSAGKETYSVLGNTLTPNERLVIDGKKMKSDTGEPVVEVRDVRKDLGRCEVPTTSARK